MAPPSADAQEKTHLGNWYRICMWSETISLALNEGGAVHFLPPRTLSSPPHFLQATFPHRPLRVRLIKRDVLFINLLHYKYGTKDTLSFF